MFDKKIHDLGESLVNGFLAKADEIAEEIKKSPELKAPFTLRLIIMKDIAAVISAVTRKV